MEQSSKPLSVSEFVDLVNKNLEIFEDIKVIGEVSEFKISQGRWVFFKLKDENAVVECFLMIYQLNYQIQDGMLVEVIGTPNLHKRSGRFRIKVSSITPYGEGSILKSFLLLKEKLEKEGLFDESRKRKIIEFPEKIGLITSRDSAGFKDFIKILKHRFCGIKIYFINVFVQGEEAISQIVSAIDYFSKNGSNLDLDAIVLTRGGGSLEDLNIFNSEDIARAIFASKVPVIAGIGHEKDTTIAELVADIRASTPSNAAELLVRHRDDISLEITHITHKIENLLLSQFDFVNSLIEEFYSRSLHFIKDQKFLLSDAINIFYEKLKNYKNYISNIEKELNYIYDNINAEIFNLFQFSKKDFQREKSLLLSYSPINILKRGYSFIRSKDKKLIKSVKSLKKGDFIEAILYDGSFISKVNKIFSKDSNLFGDNNLL